MKKIICITSITLFLILGVIACGNENRPKEPTPDEVIRDTQAYTSKILLGITAEKDEKFPLSPLIIDEWDVKFSKGKEKLDAEVTAIVGNKLWISEEKKTIIIHYQLNKLKQWSVQGVSVNDPVIRVISRSAQTEERA